jgi:hypothetical protein
VISDKRLKTNIHSFSDGWSVLKEINPIWYSYTGEGGLPKGELAIGTTAQELQKVAPYMVSSWTYTSEKGEPTEYLSVNYHALFFILTNTIKEQQEKIESFAVVSTDLKEKIATLESENSQIKSQLADITNQLASLADQPETSYMNNAGKNVYNNNTNIPSLSQNVPNPFSQNTVITYFVPNTTISAHIILTSLKGEVVRTVNISKNGSGEVIINTGTLSPGVYQYTLVIDGNMVDTKKLEIGK